MTDEISTTAPTAALPLFHSNVVPLDAGRHGALRLNRDAGYGYSAGAATIPIGIDEFEAAANSYPILFTDGPRPHPVVLLGMREGWNLFVSESGEWMPGVHVPALVRAFPFAFIEDSAGGSRMVGIEADAACLSLTAGLPLFENGQATSVVADAVAFCEACQANLAESAAFGDALDQAGVLAPQEATIEAHGGAAARIAGFRTVDRARLAAVPDAGFLEWRRRNWLMPLYAHLLSAANWVPFTELATNALAARQ
jgi:hypothetical protein